MALEAIGGTLAGQLVREPAQPVVGGPEAESSAPTSVPAEAPVNPGKRFFSPIMEYNGDAAKLVVLFRDPKTGEVTDQIPKKQALERYAEARRQQSREAYESLLSGRAAQGDGGAAGPKESVPDAANDAGDDGTPNPAIGTGTFSVTSVAGSVATAGFESSFSPALAQPVANQGPLRLVV